MFIKKFYLFGHNTSVTLAGCNQLDCYVFTPPLLAVGGGMSKRKREERRGKGGGERRGKGGGEGKRKGAEEGETRRRNKQEGMVYESKLGWGMLTSVFTTQSPPRFLISDWIASTAFLTVSTPFS